MRLLDRLITRLLDGRLDALVARKVEEQVEALKLDALYRHRWHGDPSRLRIHETAVVNNALFNVSGGTITVGKDAFFGHDVAVLTGTHDIEVRAAVDRLPFATGSVTALRANHVLEHQSYELVGETLREWARVLAPGGRLDIGVPDARFVAEQWVRGEIDTAEANHWILGGHSERAAHRGVDARGVPLWIWNAHHTMFDAASLRAAVEEFFEVDELFTYDIRNLRVYGHAR